MSGWLKAMLLAILTLYVMLALLSRLDGLARAENKTVIEPLPMTFAHVDHVDQNCLVCHHDYNDDSGTGQCIDCHLRDPTVAHLFEEQFHGLCMGCHAEKYLEGKDHGPLRHCIECHQTDQLP